MMEIIKIQLCTLPVTLPVNKENHELLVPICKKLALSTIVEEVYLHSNTIYIKMDTQLNRIMDLSIELGANLYRAFKHDPGAKLTRMRANLWNQIQEFEMEAAHMLYAEYLETLQTDPTVDLFGINGIVPFEKLPEFFRKGSLFPGLHDPRQEDSGDSINKTVASMQAMNIAFKKAFGTGNGTSMGIRTP